MHFKSRKSCIGGVACRIGAVLSTSTPALSFAISPLLSSLPSSFFISSRSFYLSPPRFSFFVSHVYIFLSLCHTHTRVPLTDEVQRTRERGACAGLHDCRNCRYAAKVEGVQRQPCARLLSVFLSVFFPPPFSFFFSLSPLLLLRLFFPVFFFFHKKVMVHSCSDKISKNGVGRKKLSPLRDRHSRYSIFFLSMSFARIFRPCINLQKEHGDSILLPWLQHFVALQMFVLNVTLKFERKRKENYLR